MIGKKYKKSTMDGNAFNKKGSQAKPGMVGKGFSTNGYKMKAQGNPETGASFKTGKLELKAQGHPMTQKTF